jgi:hypothetical protein
MRAVDRQRVAEINFRLASSRGARRGDASGIAEDLASVVRRAGWLMTVVQHGKCWHRRLDIRN